jgi:hypothetical protein
MPTIYKSFNYYQQANNKPVYSVDETTKNQLNNIVLSFITYFKTKHL